MLGHRALRENSTIFQNNELHFVNSCSLVIIITNVIIVIAPYTLRVYLPLLPCIITPENSE